MRVMILTADYPPCNWSGIGVTVERQACALAALGIEVHVLVAAQPPPGHYQQQNSTGPKPTVHYLTGPRSPVDPARFDLFHLHSLALSELAFQLHSRFSLPFIYTVHSLFHLELAGRSEAAFWCAVQGRVLALSDSIIFLSEAERSKAIDLLPEIAPRTRVLPNGIPTPATLFPAPCEPEPGLVVFAGRFTRSKGIQILVEMIPLLLERYDAQFVLIGGHGDPESHQAVKQLCDQYPDACRMPGWLSRQELDRLFAIASLVLIPSLYEPFGLVALEAMRMGAPVLSSGAGGLAEIVKLDSGGRQLDSQDPQQWAKAAWEILSNPGVKQKMRAQGPKYVAANYNLYQITKQLVQDVYETV